MEVEGTQTPDGWTRGQSQLHADCRVFRIYRQNWQNQRTGLAADFFVMEVRDWAVAIAMTEDGQCVLVNQFRFGSGTFSWELPAGLVEAGESPEAGVRRELFEESGYSGGDCIKLGELHPNPAIQNNRCHIYLLRGVRKTGDGEPDEHESLTVGLFALEEVYAMARDGRIQHGIVPAALFYLKMHLEGV